MSTATLAPEHLSFDVDADGVATIVWNSPGKTMNVLGEAVIAELEAAVARVLETESIRGAVITSGKAAFSAGADLEAFEQLAPLRGPQRRAPAFALGEGARRLQAVYRRLENGGKPFAAAINGTALGGGFELCLACHYRVAADDGALRIGLPEAKVGLFPAAGGTQRLPRMLGIMTALPFLLEGQAVGAQRALGLKLVDAVVPAGEVVGTAQRWVAAAKPEAAVKPWDKPRFRPPGPDVRSTETTAMFAAGNALLRKRTFGRYPALDAIEQLVYEGLLLPIERALELETRHFTRLLLDPTATNMVRTLFINLQKANRLEGRPAGVAPRRVQRLGVLGAGMMGAGIAHVAAQSGIDVVLLDRDEETAARGLAHARKLEEKEVERGRLAREKAEATLGRIRSGADFGALAGVELVVEAVFEDRAVKADVTRRSESILGPAAIFASNTSTLPIASLAAVSSRPQRFIGIHFFSPVERMPLVEVIVGKQTGDDALACALDFVRQLGKTPIVVNDSRGFYTSRVFGTYTMEGIAMLAEGITPALIENAGRAAGMPMPPLALSDEVALDLIHKVALQTRRDLGDAYRETTAEKLVARLVEQGRLGKKAGRGFYEYGGDGTKRLWPGLGELAPLAEVQPSVEALIERLLSIQALEAVRCLEEGVLRSPADGDVGAVLGWGFAPWTGGPFSYVDTLGAPAFLAICERLAVSVGERFTPNDLLRRAARDDATLYSP